MHHKALLFGDDETAAEVLRCGHPRAAKGLGRKVKNFDEKKVSSIHTFTYIYIYIYIYTCDGAVAGHVRSRFDEQWVANRERIVFEGNYAKFTRPVAETSSTRTGGARTLLDRLLATGDGELVEASPFDPIWGIGLAEAQAGDNREAWGLNLLGKALMAVRERIKQEQRQGQGMDDAGDALE